MKTFTSYVKGFEGECAPVWLNSKTDARIFGARMGYFKLVKKRFGIKFKTGTKFHGYITSNNEIKTTEGIYSPYQFE